MYTSNENLLIACKRFTNTQAPQVPIQIGKLTFLNLALGKQATY